MTYKDIEGIICHSKIKRKPLVCSYWFLLSSFERTAIWHEHPHYNELSHKYEYLTSLSKTENKARIDKHWILQTL